MSKCPSSNATLKKAAILSLAAMLVGAPAITLASTFCEGGRITLMELRDGNESSVLISTGQSTTGDWRKAVSLKGIRVTEMWYKASDTRWRDRLALLRMAFSLQLPIKMSSEDDNCIGNADEFTITVCSVDGPC